MKEKLEQIYKEAKEQIDKIDVTQGLNDLRIKYLGKKGQLTEILKGMGKLSPEERPKLGSIVNEIRDSIVEAIETKEKELKQNDDRKTGGNQDFLSVSACFAIRCLKEESLRLRQGISGCQCRRTE